MTACSQSYIQYTVNAQMSDVRRLTVSVLHYKWWGLLLKRLYLSHPHSLWLMQEIRLEIIWVQKMMDWAKEDR